jgi:hypothetical protein
VRRDATRVQQTARLTDAFVVARLDSKRRYGPGKWRLIQKDEELSKILHNRSNVDLKDKWRNLHATGSERSSTPTIREREEKQNAADGGGDVPSTSAKTSASSALKRRKTDDAKTLGGIPASEVPVDAPSFVQSGVGAPSVVTNQLFGEVQKAKREAEIAAEAAASAQALADQAEKEAWEAEELASQLIAEAQRQKDGLPVVAPDDNEVVDVAAELLGQED